MLNEGPRYHHAAKTAAAIINLHATRDEPPAVRFATILFLILEAMDAAERELAEMRRTGEFHEPLVASLNRS
jgi:hypothetical protein